MNINNYARTSSERTMKSNRPSHRRLFTIATTLAALFLPLGCANNTATTNNTTGEPAPTEDANGVVHFTQEQAGVPQSGQSMFLSPEEATQAFRDAVAGGDRRTLVAIFGGEGRQLIFSGDRVQEDNDMRSLAQRMGEYLHVDRKSDTTAVLLIGQENWPFPIPVVKCSQGWFFDTAAGKDELLNRRIGEDELNAISVCQAYVVAQKESARTP